MKERNGERERTVIYGQVRKGKDEGREQEWKRKNAEKNRERGGQEGDK